MHWFNFPKCEYCLVFYVFCDSKEDIFGDILHTKHFNEKTTDRLMKTWNQ